MSVLAIGQVWKYVGDNQQRYGEEYVIHELLPAVKVPNWGWHRAVRYRPMEPVATAPNDYVRTEADFRGCFRFVR